MRDRKLFEETLCKTETEVLIFFFFVKEVASEIHSTFTYYCLQDQKERGKMFALPFAQLMTS